MSERTGTTPSSSLFQVGDRVTIVRCDRAPEDVGRSGVVRRVIPLTPTFSHILVRVDGGDGIAETYFLDELEAE